MVEEELQGRTDTRAGGLLRNVLSLPFWVHQVPVGFEFFRIDEIGIEIKAGRSRIGDVDKNMLLLGVVVAVFAAVPFGFVENFRKDQRGLDRIENLSFVENLKVGD